jgi:hypothetical protein
MSTVGSRINTLWMQFVDVDLEMLFSWSKAFNRTTGIFVRINSISRSDFQRICYY